MLNMLPSAHKMRDKTRQQQARMLKQQPRENGGEKLKHLLHQHHLRPTKQRLVIAACLFSKPERHIHADMLHDEITASGAILSIATIYNSLRCFCSAGLIRAVASRGNKQWFCTDIGNRCQYYLDDGEQIAPVQKFSSHVERLSDKATLSLDLPNASDIPEGYEITHIDISIHLEKINKTHIRLSSTM